MDPNSSQHTDSKEQAPHTPSPHASANSKGFGYSNKQIGLEIAFIAAGLVGLIVLVIWLAGVAAQALVPAVPIEVDEALGNQSWTSLAPKEKRCGNQQVIKYVEDLAAPLLPHLDTPFKFEFTVVDDPSINAFALPGGFVAVHMGLIDKAESGEEIAAVLAHEMIHVTKRHGTKRVLRQLGGMAVIGAIFGGTDIELPAYAMGGLVSNAYDRDQETEADTLGQAAMKAAGINPIAMASFFVRLAEDGAAPPELLSTHPDPGNRAERAREAAEGFRPKLRLPSPAGLECN